jgi:hypothetical protein
VATFKELIKRENEIVNSELLLNPDCMNLKLGGEGGIGLVWTNEGKANLSKALKGRKHTGDALLAIAAGNIGKRKGSKASASTRARMSESHLGITHTSETKEKISASHKGKKLSDEHIKNIGLASTGRKQTDYAKQRVSEAHKDKPLNDEHKIKIANALKGKKKSPEHLKNFHAAIERRRLLKNASSDKM